jgi:hypothetical protein
MKRAKNMYFKVAVITTTPDTTNLHTFTTVPTEEAAKNAIMAAAEGWCEERAVACDTIEENDLFDGGMDGKRLWLTSNNSEYTFNAAYSETEGEDPSLD